MPWRLPLRSPQLCQVALRCWIAKCQVELVRLLSPQVCQPIFLPLVRLRQLEMSLLQQLRWGPLPPCRRRQPHWLRQGPHLLRCGPLPPCRHRRPRWLRRGPHLLRWPLRRLQPKLQRALQVQSAQREPLVLLEQPA